MSTYTRLKDELESQGIKRHCSELHGMIVGFVCCKTEVNSLNVLTPWLNQYFNQIASPRLISIMESSLKEVLDSLGDYSDFEFDILLPEEPISLNERVLGLSAWCSGFLAGVRRADIEILQREGSLVNETLSDFKRISEITDDVEENDDNEADFIELQEFARVGALVIFTETRSPKI